MANRLKNMRLTSVDLVRNGANQEADICLFKSAEEDPADPTTEEKNIFKRFINWLRENPTEGEDEPENPIEKADEQPDLTEVYKSAISESLQSIIADESLTAAEKNDMISKSLDEYHEAMLTLIDLSKADSDEEEDEDDGDREDEEDEVQKFNPNHDSLGRFASGGGGASAAVGGKAQSKGQQAFESLDKLMMGKSSQKAKRAEGTEFLKKIPKGSTISVTHTDASGNTHRTDYTRMDKPQWVGSSYGGWTESYYINGKKQKSMTRATTPSDIVGDIVHEKHTLKYDISLGFKSPKVTKSSDIDEIEEI